MVDKTSAVCYEYRAKNGFGAIRLFHAVLARDGVTIKAETEKGFSSLWNKECTGKLTGDEAVSSTNDINSSNVKEMAMASVVYTLIVPAFKFARGIKKDEKIYCFFHFDEFSNLEPDYDEMKLDPKKIDELRSKIYSLASNLIRPTTVVVVSGFAVSGFANSALTGAGAADTIGAIESAAPSTNGVVELATCTPTPSWLHT